MHKQQKTKYGETPRFHPISALPMVASVLDGQLAEAQKLLRTLLQAQGQPHVLDDTTVDRLVRAYSETLEHVPLFQEQLARWNKGPLTETQAAEVRRLAGQADALGQVCEDLLGLGQELRKGTIDRILEMSDEEIALKVLAGELKPPRK